LWSVLIEGHLPVLEVRDAPKGSGGRRIFHIFENDISKGIRSQKASKKMTAILGTGRRSKRHVGGSGKCIAAGRQ